MQPDPSVYLRAIRRELLSPELFAGGLETGASAVIAMRAASCLGQLALRGETLPRQLADLRPGYAALLERVVAKLGGDGAAGGLASIPGLIAASAGNIGGEDEIRLHDAISDAISEGLRLLSRQSPPPPDMLELSRAACALEHQRRQGYNQALASLERSEAAEEAAAALPAVTEPELTAFLRAKLPDSPEIAASEVRRLAGFNSKEIFFLAIDGHAGWPRASVMRREPAFNATGAALTAEWALLDHLRSHGVPVPRVLIADRGDERGGDFIIMERLAGAPRDASSLGPEGRTLLLHSARLAAQFHQVPLPGGSPLFGDPRVGPRERMRALVQSYYDRWLAERPEDSLIIESAYIWLRENLWRVSDQTALVHGDFNLRNILLDGDRISAVLDWELCHAGDPAEDLAYIRPDVERVMDWSEFLREYQSHSSLTVSEESLAFFRVFTDFWRVVISAITFGGYIAGKHDNFIYASTGFAEYRTHGDLLASHITQS